MPNFVCEEKNKKPNNQTPCAADCSWHFLSSSITFAEDCSEIRKQMKYHQPDHFCTTSALCGPDTQMFRSRTFADYSLWPTQIPCALWTLIFFYTQAEERVSITCLGLYFKEQLQGRWSDCTIKTPQYFHITYPWATELQFTPLILLWLWAAHRGSEEWKPRQAHQWALGEQGPALSAW